MSEWLPKNFADVVSILGIFGLVFTAVSIREDTKERRISNFQTLVANHREIWKLYIEEPQLARVLDPSANLTEHPIDTREETFVNMVILHVSTSYYARNDELLMKVEGEVPDIARFFSLPIPNAVWQKTKPLQNHDFVAFVEAALKQV